MSFTAACCYCTRAKTAVTVDHHGRMSKQRCKESLPVCHARNCQQEIACSCCWIFTTEQSDVLA